LGHGHIELLPAIGKGDDVVVDDGHDLLDDFLPAAKNGRRPEHSGQNQSRNDSFHSTNL